MLRPRPLLLAVLLLCLCSTSALGQSPGAPPPAVWLQGQIVAHILPEANEGYIQLSRRVLEEPDKYPEIVAFNGDRPVEHGRPVLAPLNLLKPELRGRILRALYPEDELTERGWAHHVTDPLETLIQLTEAYTGSKRRFKELARYNRIANPNVLPKGGVVTVPLAWIPESLGFGPTAVREPLALLRERASGRTFATYSLRKDETLYSVVLRFTDRTHAAEVSRMAAIMLRLNGLRDLRFVPAGRPLKMPIEWISEEYLVQPGIARRPAPPPRAPRPSTAAGTLHVIVDPGHGGVDPGAVYGGRKGEARVYEHEVVYDIALRLVGLLNSRGYVAHLTVRDPGQTLPVTNVSTAALGKERVAVTPPYLIESPNVAVNMRVFLVDAIYRRLTRQRVRPEEILLVSIHGDALAPTLRGAMVYFPDHRLRVDSFQPRGRVYRIRQEAVPSRIAFSAKAMQEAHWSSQAFAEEIAKALREQGVRVGARRPVRPYYYREGERTLPAVLRYSRVPSSVLVEIGNLNNRHDRRALLRNSTRQKIAVGLVTAIRRHGNGGPALAVARKGG